MTTEQDSKTDSVSKTDDVPPAIATAREMESYPFFVDTSETWWLTSVEADDREDVERIYEQEWGEAHADALDPVFGSSGADQAVVARTTDRVVGFAIWMHRDAHATDSYFEGFNIDWSSAARVSILHMICVDEDWQGRGIGTALVRWWVEQLQAAWRVSHAAAVSWHRDDHHDSRRLFEQFDFEQLQTVDEYYWRPDYTRTNCPDCPGICTCDASAWAKFIKHVDEEDQDDA